MLRKDSGEMNGKQKKLMLLALLNRSLFKMTNVHKVYWENQSRTKENFENLKKISTCFLSNRGSEISNAKDQKAPTKLKAYQNR